jgi:hypothetical protein
MDAHDRPKVEVPGSTPGRGSLYGPVVQRTKTPGYEPGG